MLSLLSHEYLVAKTKTVNYKEGFCKGIVFFNEKHLIIKDKNYNNHLFGFKNFMPKSFCYYLDSNSLIINVKNFGAKGDGIHDDTQAIQDAINSLPPIDGHSMAKQGSKEVLIKKGTIFFPSGTYLISKTIYITSGMQLYGVSSQYSSIIKLKDDSFNDKEQFMIEVCPSKNGENDFRSNITHGTQLRDLYIDCNGEKNISSSGVKWYGAELNSLSKLVIAHFRFRGLVINDPRDNKINKGNSTFIDQIWISGLYDKTTGPGLDLSGNSIIIGEAIVQHINTSGNFRDVDNDPIPAINIEKAEGISALNLTDEDTYLFLKVKNTIGLSVETLSAASNIYKQGSIALKIIGDSRTNRFDHINCRQKQIMVFDSSASQNLKNYFVQNGNPNGISRGSYVQDVQLYRSWLGNKLQPSNVTLGVSGIVRFTNQDKNIPAEAIIDADDNQSKLTFSQNGHANSSIVSSGDKNLVFYMNASGKKFQLNSDGSIQSDNVYLNKAVPFAKYLEEIQPSFNYQIIVTIDNSIQGDGKGGIYYWDDSSHDFPDGVNVLKVKSIENGRWKKINK
jgi:hypothetical protein